MIKATKRAGQRKFIISIKKNEINEWVKWVSDERELKKAETNDLVKQMMLLSLIVMLKMDRIHPKFKSESESEWLSKRNRWGCNLCLKEKNKKSLIAFSHKLSNDNVTNSWEVIKKACNILANGLRPLCTLTLLYLYTLYCVYI